MPSILKYALFALGAWCFVQGAAFVVSAYNVFRAAGYGA